MLLSELLKDIITRTPDFDAEITSIAVNSEKAKSGSLFFCLSERRTENRNHAVEALKNGASAVVASENLGLPDTVTVKNIRKTLARCCDRFYSNPAQKLKLIGVTGTNGKTSVSYMIKHILEFCGKNTGIIGTVGNFSGEKELINTDLTTPEPVEMYAIFNSLVRDNAEYCVMEASSQALKQGRCESLNFETAVFTNLTAEHLDYHGDMGSYAKAKRKLFEQSCKCVLNLDDKYFSFFSGVCKTLLTYSVRNNNADLFADNIKLTDRDASYDLHTGGGVCSVNLNVPGMFSVSNSLAAIGCCVFSGLPVEKCADALSTFGGVRGRAEIIGVDAPFTVMTDYAHTPDALRNILSSVKVCANGRVISLFGCGGDRDKQKRPLMLEAAAENSDYVVITSDNPRNENPYDIIRDILKSADKCGIPFAVIENRRDAIKYALSIAGKEDTVVLCGKGHETYQIIGKEKVDFDERKIVYDYINDE